LSRPVVGSFAESLYTSISPLAWDDENQGWALLHLCEAIGRMFQPVEDISRDTEGGPGWSQGLDPDRAPSWALAWLAQFGGVTLMAGLDEAAQREQIKSLDATKRGTPDAIRAAAALHLTGSKSVVLVQRDGSAWRWTVRTTDDETPNSAQVLRDILTQKPGGDRLNYEILASIPTYGELPSLMPTYGDIPLYYYDYDDLRSRTAHGPLIHYVGLPGRFASYQDIADNLASYKLLREQHT
jgi:hypothetical protein